MTSFKTPITTETVAYCLFNYLQNRNIQKRRKDKNEINDKKEKNEKIAIVKLEAKLDLTNALIQQDNIGARCCEKSKLLRLQTSRIQLRQTIDCESYKIKRIEHKHKKNTLVPLDKVQHKKTKREIEKLEVQFKNLGLQVEREEARIEKRENKKFEKIEKKEEKKREKQEAKLLAKSGDCSDGMDINNNLKAPIKSIKRRK